MSFLLVWTPFMLLVLTLKIAGLIAWTWPAILLLWTAPAWLGLVLLIVVMSLSAVVGATH